MIWVSLICLLAMGAGAIIAERKGRSMEAWSLLCIMFPISILLLLALPSKKSSR